MNKVLETIKSDLTTIKNYLELKDNITKIKKELEEINKTIQTLEKMNLPVDNKLLDRKKELENLLKSTELTEDLKVLLKYLKIKGFIQLNNVGGGRKQKDITVILTNGKELKFKSFREVMEYFNLNGVDTPKRIVKRKAKNLPISKIIENGTVIYEK